MLRSMRAPIRVRALTDDEHQAIEDSLRSSDAFVLRRCQIIRASVREETAPTIAAALGCSDQTVRDVLHAFNTDGLAVLERRSSRPHTIHLAIDADGAERLRELLHQSPRAFGKPTSVWTLPLVAEVCAEIGLTAERVSGETIRQTLVRLDIRWQRAKHWISSPDPEYAKKKPVATA
jgi:transposase